MSIKNQLQDVHSRIMATEKPKELKNMLPFELLPLIEENDELNKFYTEHLEYYERLSKDIKYLDLIKEIHDLMRQLHGIINPSKLPDSPRLFAPKREDPEDEPWIPMKELHAMLIDDKSWWYLGGITIMSVEDSVKCPFNPVIRQYEIVLGLTENAWKSGALDEKKSDPVIGQFQEKVKELEMMLKKPFYRLHIREFEFLDNYMREPGWIGNDKRDIERVHEYVDRVCKDLLQCIDVHEEMMENFKRFADSDSARRLQYVQRDLAKHLPEITKTAELSMKEMSRPLSDIQEAMRTLDASAINNYVEPLPLPSVGYKQEPVVPAGYMLINEEKLEMLIQERVKSLIIQHERMPVSFDEKSGNVMVGEKVVGEIDPATREFFFFQRLYKDIGKPVSHNVLCDYVREKMHISASYSPSGFTSKLKGDLKKSFTIDIAELIRPMKISEKERGYSLRDRVKISEN